MRGPDRSGLGADVRLEGTKNFLAYTLLRLGTDYIDVYRRSRRATCRLADSLAALDKRLTPDEVAAIDASQTAWLDSEKPTA